jgi:molybdenum cofactor synthesis domain-containing protein
MTRKAHVIVSSDRSFHGTYEDLSGPAAVKWLADKHFDVTGPTVVPDDANALSETVLSAIASGNELIVISGGTGLSPRDITPQTLDRLCDYDIPGFGELLRAESVKYSLNAYLSRCGGWVKDNRLILALPGNPKAVVEQLGILETLLDHAIKAVHGECSHRRKTPGHEG